MRRPICIQHLVGNGALIHKSVLEPLGLKEMIATDQNLLCDIFDNKSAAQTCLCDALSAWQHFVEKRAKDHKSVYVAAKTKGKIAAH
jgi:hypothetical protein